jgi:Cu+-exporting ATPase
MPTEEKNERYSRSFTVEGMTCATCVKHVERSLSRLPGVLLVSVSLANDRGVVVSETPVSPGDISKAVAAAGYKSRPEVLTERDLETRHRRIRRRFFSACAMTLPLAVLMVFDMLGWHISGFNWLELIGGSVVVFWSGAGIFRGAWIAARHWHANMDTLVSIGSLTALATAVFPLIGMDLISFGAIAPMLTTLHLGGRYIESRLRERTTRSVRSLLSLQSKQVTVIKDEIPFEIPVEAVKSGDVVLVKSGEMIALDGEVISGKGHVDESMISGEPIPVRKEASMPVTGGTLVTGGSLVYEVKRIGGETFLARMIRLVAEAQHAKIPIQALADRITMYFIPVVFGLAVLGGVFWVIFHSSWHPFLQKVSNFLPWINTASGPVSTGIFVFITTVLIACPCALGLATPMALAAATGLSARLGLIIRNGEALQSSRSIDLMMLDKTGTITEGRPRVVWTDLNDAVLTAAAAIELHSQHPAAQAVVAHARTRGLAPSPQAEDVVEKAGSGISGKVGGITHFIGKPVSPKSNGGGRDHAGIMIIEVRKNGKHEGFLHLSDPVKDDARSSVSELRRMGIETMILSGDDIDTVRSVADQVGVTQFRGGVTPAQKMEIMREFQIAGSRVAMVGDGINDAAALKSADLGIAMGTGTELAMESGDIVAVHGDLSRVVDAIKISKLTFRVIRQNLFWAFIYNLVAIPLALAGFLHPLIAEAAMTLSSVAVILNSSRIARMHVK